jgi:predicted dehydrogenase
LLIPPRFQTFPGVRFVAVCDVNSTYLAEGRNRAGGDQVAAYKDYRKLLEDKNVDAVIIATNQQWHDTPMIAACQAGKDVYLEKPLGNSVGEGPFAIQAWHKYKRIVQVGTQQRSQEHYRQAVELIRTGKLGEISEVRVWDYENYWLAQVRPPTPIRPRNWTGTFSLARRRTELTTPTCITTTATTGSGCPVQATRLPGACTISISYCGRWA